MNPEMLKSRTKKYALDVARFCEELPPRFSLEAYSRQLVRCSSSVGANYRAACRAKSNADFVYKLKIVEEEADESMFFLELISELETSRKAIAEKLIREGNEILSIIVASINTARHKTLPKKYKL